MDPAIYERAAAALRQQPGGDRIDTVVLACTHFPLVEDELARAFGPDVRFVHGAQGIARRIAALTAGQSFARSKPDLALFTRNEAQLAELAPALQRHGLLEIEVF